MKAVSKSIRSNPNDNKEENNRVDVPEDDGVVMVLFPRQTWDRIQEIALKSGKRSAEILSMAIEMLSDNMEEK
jgi:hypothetical protein